eukprot:9018193-Alexandrium_andersonii.AAC.1
MVEVGNTANDPQTPTGTKALERETTGAPDPKRNPSCSSTRATNMPRDCSFSPTAACQSVPETVRWHAVSEIR